MYMFELILYVPVNIFSVMLGPVFLVEAVLQKDVNQGHKTVPPLRL